VLHGFIVDFCCLHECIVIELAGDAHDSVERQSYDRARTEFLTAAGFRVIRVRNKEVSQQHLESMLRKVLRTHPSSPVVPPLRNGEGDRG